MASGIYGIFQGNRVYIGQSSDIDRRWYEHKSDLKLNQHHCQFLQNIYNKHGLSSLEFSILEVCSVSELNDLETKVWEDYEAKGFTMMNSKPEGGVLRGENHHRFGRKHTDQARAKMSESRLGKIFSDETKAKIREAKLGENHPFFGRTHTEEARAKQRESQEKFSYIILEVSTGARYETNNLNQWCKDRKVHNGNLQSTFNGSRKTAYGYKIVSKVEL